LDFAQKSNFATEPSLLLGDHLGNGEQHDGERRQGAQDDSL
jgi:hypothetical protein